jgi:quinol monooxygenase YgiN
LTSSGAHAPGDDDTKEVTMSTPEDTVPDGLMPADVLASTTPVAVYGFARARTGKEKALDDAIRAIIPTVRAEQGYEQYAVHTSKEQPGAFAFYERWSSGADIARHVQQPHMQDYFGKLADLVEGDLEAEWLWPLSD